jgi:hypothetical protein
MVDEQQKKKKEPLPSTRTVRLEYHGIEYEFAEVKKNKPDEEK